MRETISDSCGGKRIRLLGKSCKSNNPCGGGGILKYVGDCFYSKASGVGGGEGGGGEGGRRADNLCVEAINHFKGIHLTVLGKKKKKGNAQVYYRGGGCGGGWACGAAQSVRGNYTFF